MIRRLPFRMQVLALFGCSAMLLAGCASTPEGSPRSAASAAGPQGRSECPGSAPVALTDLRGAAADTLEQLQSTYEAKPGFLAVIFDGTKAIVVVEAERLPEWLTELMPKGIAVAPSCVDPALTAAVKAAIPGLAPVDGIAGAGYNGLDDAIEVVGVDPDTLLAALDAKDAGLGDRARAAITAGTLRINGQKVSGSR